MSFLEIPTNDILHGNFQECFSPKRPVMVLISQRFHAFMDLIPQRFHTFMSPRVLCPTSLMSSVTQVFMSLIEVEHDTLCVSKCPIIKWLCLGAWKIQKTPTWSSTGLLETCCRGFDSPVLSNFLTHTFLFGTFDQQTKKMPQTPRRHQDVEAPSTPMCKFRMASLDKIKAIYHVDLSSMLGIIIQKLYYDP